MATLWGEPILKSLTFPIFSFDGKETSNTIQLKPEVFSVSMRRDLVHNAFYFYRMLNLITTHRTKRRKDMIASKKKVRPQKGSGRARAGFRYAPRMKGGMKAHGPFPRDFSVKMNKKMILQALKVTLAAKLSDKTMIIVDGYPSALNKTKDVAKALAVYDSKCLFIYQDELTSNFLLASRSLSEFIKVNIKEVNVKNLILAKKILITADGILSLQENLIKAHEKLFSNRKLYRKIKEEKKIQKAIEPVVIKTKILKEIVKKYELDVATS